MHATKKAVTALVVIVLVIAIGAYVIHQPTTAAHTTRGVVGGLSDAGDAIGNFFHHLIG